MLRTLGGETGQAMKRRKRRRRRSAGKREEVSTLAHYINNYLHVKEWLSVSGGCNGGRGGSGELHFCWVKVDKVNCKVQVH